MASESKGDIRILEQTLREATDHGRGAVKVYRAEATLALAELSAAKEMREVLRELEWSGIINDYDYCPVCNGGYQDHRPDCRLARLIGGDRG